MLEKILNYTTNFLSTHTWRRNPCFFIGDSVIKVCEGTQQGDPESPAFLSKPNQNLIGILKSKINLWYFDDGNLSDNHETVSKDLKKLLEQKKHWYSELNPQYENLFHWRHH